MDSNIFNKKTVKLLLLPVISAFLAFILVSDTFFDYFFHLGFAFIAIVFAGLIFDAKGYGNNYDKAIYAIIAVLSFFVFYRANIFLSFLNLTAIIYLLSFLAFYKPGRKITFFRLVILPVDVFFTALFTENKYYDHKKLIESAPKTRQKGLVSGVVITTVVLIIIIPLLAYSNPFFEESIINIVNLIADFRLISVLNLLRILVFLWFIFFLPKLLTLVEKDFEIANTSSESKNPYENINLTIPRTVVALVILAFFVAQLKLYFASQETLELLRISNSQQTREIFAQMSVVAIVVFTLIYIKRNYDKTSEYLTYTLSFQGIFLALIAFKSVFDYSSNWGFTHKRLYGFAVVFWLLAIFTLFLYSYLNRRTNTDFLKKAILITSSVLILINIFNFDYLIYHTNQARTHSGTDYVYLARLSTDANHHNDLMSKMIRDIENERDTDTINEINTAKSILSRRQEKLAIKYRLHGPTQWHPGLPSAYLNKYDFRAFSLSEYIYVKSAANSSLLEEKLEQQIVDKRLEYQTEHIRFQNVTATEDGIE